MKTFALSLVTLLPGPFQRGLHTDLEYVLAMDPDRLLAPFLREAGLPAVGESYPNWEDSGLDGHTAGHYLSALSLLVVGTGDTRARGRLDYVVAEIARAQDAIGTGYVGGVPGGVALFEALRHGGPGAAASLGSSDHWVPWYNLHKTFAGLIDAYRHLAHEQALAVVTRLADWWLEIAATMDDESFETMLVTEFGGMNDAYAELASLTGRDDYATMAYRFSHRLILDPLLERRDDLAGRHANTQIPKVVGYATTAAVHGDAELRQAADYFWQRVVEKRSVAIGGNSVREHFHAVDDFSPMIEDREGPEFCNSYNMLKLTKALAEAELKPEYLDVAERILYNHVLASQHPERGGFVYFTPMRPRHYRVYSQPEHAFWCCVGTGMEAQAKYGELVFGVEGEALAINLYAPAELEATEFGGRVRVDTGFPFDELVTVTVESDEAFPLRLRVPGWSDGLVDLAVNGSPVNGVAVPGAVVLERRWRSGDAVTFRLPLEVSAERLPDGSPWQAYFAGPILLAARAGEQGLAGLVANDSRMGHVARGPLLGFADVPIVGDAPASSSLTAVGPLTYELELADPSGAVRLEPFFGVHDSRYTVYWPIASPDALAERRAELERADRDSLALDAMTVDFVAFGEQQPESDHGYRGTEAEVGLDGDRHWRSTRRTMAVMLKDPGHHGRLLRVGFRTLGEPVHVAIRVNGVVLSEETFEGGAEYFDIDYGLPGEFSDSDRPEGLEVEFAALDGLVTPGITTVRLLSWASP